MSFEGTHHNGEHNTEHNGEEDWDLKGDWEIFKKGLNKLTDALADVLQRLSEEGCYGYSKRLNKESFFKYRHTKKEQQIISSGV